MELLTVLCIQKHYQNTLYLKNLEKNSSLDEAKSIEQVSSIKLEQEAKEYDEKCVKTNSLKCDFCPLKCDGSNKISKSRMRR